MNQSDFLSASDMNCKDFCELISAEIDGDLDAQEQCALEDHLTECAACRSVQYSFLEINRFSVPAPVSVSKRVREKTANYVESHGRKRKVTIAACLTIAASVILLAVAVFSRPTKPYDVDGIVDLFTSLNYVNQEMQADQLAVENAVDLDLRALQIELEHSELDEAQRDLFEQRLQEIKNKFSQIAANSP